MLDMSLFHDEWNCSSAGYTKVANCSGAKEPLTGWSTLVLSKTSLSFVLSYFCMWDEAVLWWWNTTDQQYGGLSHQDVVAAEGLAMSPRHNIERTDTALSVGRLKIMFDIYPLASQTGPPSGKTRRGRLKLKIEYVLQDLGCVSLVFWVVTPQQPFTRRP